MSPSAISPDTTIGPDGWIEAARQIPSPNFDDRPGDSAIELLVIHAISLPLGQFSDSGAPSYIADLFQNRLDITAHPDFEQLQGVRVSTHFLIQRDGSLIQFVGVDQRAWHAGVSQFMGRSACNDFSIGVELEGSDFVPFESAQYDTLTALINLLHLHYPVHHIAGHEHIAPSRKTDPGPFFDWTLFENILRQRFPLVLANAVIHGHPVR